MPSLFLLITFTCLAEQLCRSASHPVVCFPVRLRGFVARRRMIWLQAQKSWRIRDILAP